MTHGHGWMLCEQRCTCVEVEGDEGDELTHSHQSHLAHEHQPKASVPGYSGQHLSRGWEDERDREEGGMRGRGNERD